MALQIGEGKRRGKVRSQGKGDCNNLGPLWRRARWFGPVKDQSSLRGVYNPAPAPSLTPAPPTAGLPGQRPLLLHQQGGRESRGPPPAPSAGRAGNGARAAASERRPFQVQSEIRRGWHRCRLRHSLGEEPRQRPEPAFRTLPSGSGPGQVAAGSALCSRTLPGPGGEANDVLESYC